MTLDLDHPKFQPNLDRLRRIAHGIEAAKQRGGLVGKTKQIGLSMGAAAGFARLYLLPVKQHEPPARVRLAPTW